MQVVRDSRRQRTMWRSLPFFGCVTALLLCVSTCGTLTAPPALPSPAARLVAPSAPAAHPTAVPPTVAPLPLVTRTPLPPPASTSTPDPPAPPARTATPAPTTAPLPDHVRLSGVPLFGEQHNLSCEYASARMIAAYWGVAIDESEFIAAIGLNANPHRGFRGDIDGIFGPLDNYGVYAEPIAGYLNTRGFRTKLLAGDEVTLKQELARGRPVLVWLTYALHQSTPVHVAFNGLPVTLVPWEHAVVVTGYDAGGVYVNGPADGSYAYFDWANFNRARGYFGGMALTFWPQTMPESANETPGVSLYFYRTFLNMGGSDFFGMPMTGTRQENGMLVQYFTRVRMEYDPHGPVDQLTTFGMLGREVSQARQDSLPFQPNARPPGTATDYFPQTQHSLGGQFQAFWQENGGAAVLGLPISEPFRENGVDVQYFERVRLEIVQGRVQLGALGEERLAQHGNLTVPSA